MKTWEPSSRTVSLITRSPVTIRTHHARYLLAEARFKVAGPIASLFGMKGITFRKDCIVLSKEFCASTNHSWQATVIFHELVHVAQQKDMGMLDFKADYFWQWIRAGGSYQKMKLFGLEQEAFAIEQSFVKGMR